MAIKKYASLETLKTFKEETDKLYATNEAVDELSSGVAYINESDNENVETGTEEVSALVTTIDSALSETSTNPVQNKVVATEINDIKEAKADWNQNDETALDYVKNRTHYEISRKNEILVDNVTVNTFAKDGDNDWYVSAENPFSLNITDMNEYTVIFDGVAYECIGERYTNYTYEDDDTIPKGYFDWKCIGNVEPIHQNSQWTNTSLPFCIAKDYYRNSGEIQVFVYNDTSASHTISIIDKTLTVQKLPLRYMPEEMPIIRKGSGIGSVVFGYPYSANIASGDGSYAEGNATTASGVCSHAEGQSTTASGKYSHAEGFLTTASGDGSHAEGNATTASGVCSHAEGNCTTASGKSSHAEGYGVTASGIGAHAEGYKTTASGKRAHAEGNQTVANSAYQHVQGKYNIADVPDENNSSYGQYAHIVGNGTTEDARSNAHTLDWDGNAWFAGSVEGTAIILKSSTKGSSKRFRITVDDSGTLSVAEITE